MSQENPILALIPLDERPVNTRYPQMLGRIGGVDVQIPPAAIMGRGREPADRHAVAAWLGDISHEAAAALVSSEFLLFGNLINARITLDTAVDSVARLAILADINEYCPVHAFSVITRVPNANDCVEEPLYWCDWGTRLARFARLAHGNELGKLSAEEKSELAELDATLPKDIKLDWLTRRLRNHTVNLSLLEMAAKGNLTSLLLTSDDTAPLGFSSRERDWLSSWQRLLGPKMEGRVLMHPGADEVGSALVARLLGELHAHLPRVWVEWAVPGDEELVAPYEDRPVRETVWGQLAACGCVLADSPEDCEFVLGVVTPVPGRGDYKPEYMLLDQPSRAPAYERFLRRLGAWQQNGMPVALADVAYPNGADPLLIEALLARDSPLRIGKLCAYGAWNTAGNTLGVVIAQAVCSSKINGLPERAQAQELFLIHRLLEDWGYQSVVRRAARDYAERLWAKREPQFGNSEQQAVICLYVEERLTAHLKSLQNVGIGQGVALTPGSVRLPWQRTFEVDFDLQQVAYVE